MNRLCWTLILGMLFGCKSETVTHQRLFTPGDKGSMIFKIPAGGLNLVIQPHLLKDRDGPQPTARVHPYMFEYETLGADQKPILGQRVQGSVTCDASADAAQKRTRRCPGARVMIDLMAGQVMPAYLKIRLDRAMASPDLYFAVTFRAPQSAYRARLHGLRLAPHEKTKILDTAYADQQSDVKQLASLSTLAPLGRAKEDYRDRVVYQDGPITSEAAPRVPSYALIGPDARIIIPLYKRDAPVRIRSMPLGESRDYLVCWQPMAEPVDGRCYKTVRSATAEATFPWPRGRLIISANQPMAIDVEYPLSPEQKFHLTDAVQQYPVHRLPQGQTLSVNLEEVQSREYLPLRVHVWALHPERDPRSAFVDLKILAPDGHVRHQERVTLDSRPSPFDRPGSDAETLSRLNSFHINANAGGGRLVISASQDILASFALGRSSTPLYSRLHAGGVIRADQEREFWIPVQPHESTSHDMVASYVWNPDAANVQAQRVLFPSLGDRPGSFALTPNHIQEMTWEGRKKSGHYVPLRSGRAASVTVERGPILPMILFGQPRRHAALRANGQTLWEGTLDRNVFVGSLDVSRFPESAPVEFHAQGADMFVSGIRLAQNMSTVYGKRFYYAQSQGSFRIQKDLPQQMMNIEVLLTEAPAAHARVQVTLQAQHRSSYPLVVHEGALEPSRPVVISAGKTGPSRDGQTGPSHSVVTRDGQTGPSHSVVTREFTHLKRDYAIDARALAPDSFLLDGTKAELLTLPVPLRSDLPPGEYVVNVTTTGLNGVLLGVSSQLPNHGIRIAAARDPAHVSGDVE